LRTLLGGHFGGGGVDVDGGGDVVRGDGWVGWWCKWLLVDDAEKTVLLDVEVAAALLID
jgi:hypothetical protein